MTRRGKVLSTLPPSLGKAWTARGENSLRGKDKSPDSHLQSLPKGSAATFAPGAGVSLCISLWKSTWFHTSQTRFWVPVLTVLKLPLVPGTPRACFPFLGFSSTSTEASLTYTFSNPATCTRCPVHCCAPQTPGKHGLHLYSAARTRDTTCLSYSCPLPCCSHLMDLDPPILPGEPASPGSLLHCP